MDDGLCCSHWLFILVYRERATLVTSYYDAGVEGVRAGYMPHRQLNTWSGIRWTRSKKL